MCKIRKFPPIIQILRQTICKMRQRQQRQCITCRGVANFERINFRSELTTPATRQLTVSSPDPFDDDSSRLLLINRE